MFIKLPAHHAPRAGVAPGGQVAPVPAHQGQVRNVAYPDLIERGRGGLAKEQVFSNDCRWVSHRGAWALRTHTQRA